MAAKFLPYLLAGISVGGQYALIAIGYTMVYGILRLINCGHALPCRDSGCRTCHPDPEDQDRHGDAHRLP